MIFLSPFLDIIWMSMSTVILTAYLPAECFPLTFDLKGFMSRVNGNLLSLGSFETAFLYALHFLLLLFLSI